MTARLLASLRRDRRGATVVEFAICAPVTLLTMLGIFDMGHNMYTSAIIQGAVQKAARDSTIEGAAGRESELDARVTDLVHQIAPNADLDFSRTAYTSFNDVGEPEDWNDVNGNGACDDGEPFEDANGNGSWDANQGTTGFGGARDAVLYEVQITWKRIVPISKMLGQSEDFSVTARSATSPMERRTRLARRRIAHEFAPFPRAPPERFRFRPRRDRTGADHAAHTSRPRWGRACQLRRHHHACEPARRPGRRQCF